MYINLITIDLCPGQNGGGVNPSGTLNISENGEYDVYSYASASVNVPSPQFVTESLSVSANGTYTPGQGVDGYSQVVVDVPQNVTGFTQKNVTEKSYEIINLNNSASFVASYAFIESYAIQTVNLPYATYVGNSAFQNCYSLTQVDLPMCSNIEFGAFNNCNSLSQVSLPMCSSISGYAFQYCYSLTQVSLPMCSSIGGNAFEYCSSLTQVSLPMCSYIDWYAFQYCYSLSQVDLPMCSFISNAAFYDCSSLTQVSLPMCSYIYYGAFQNCSSLSIITIGYSSVCYLANSEVFSNTLIASGTGSIYVPASLVDAYKSAENWSYYSSRIFPISE